MDTLFNRSAVATNSDPELLSHWAKYLCVLTAGLLENAISEVYIDFVAGCTPEPVAKFTTKTLLKIQNPKANKFVETARGFKDSWGDALADYLDQELRKDAIDSIMTNRHHIAHGKNSSVTVTRVKEWYDKSVEVINFIEQQCKS